MKNLRTWTVAVLFLCSLAPARAAARPADHASRVERLAALCRLWGVVKFFHPYLAYKDVDWDAALVAAIPKVEAATSPADLERAIDDLLAPLGDPATYAEIPASEPSGTEKAAAVAPGANPYRLEDGVMIVSVPALSRAIFDGTTGPALRPQVLADLEKARAVVMDCRTASGDEMAAYQLRSFLLVNPVGLIARDVTLGSYRYRTHSGYAPRFGTTSGGYTSGMETAAPNVVRGTSGVQKPTAFVVGEGADLDDFLVGVQAAGLATVVQETSGGAHPGASGAYTVDFPGGVKVRVRTAELVAPDGRAGFRPDLVVGPRSGSDDPAMTAALASVNGPSSASSPSPAQPAPQPRAAQDDPYNEMQFPNREYRLLALFRFWNVIDYFYPYKGLLDRPWDRVLADFIPRFEADANELEYDKTVLELAAEVEDSHVWVNNVRAWEQELGPNAPPLRLGTVEGKIVIVGVTNAEAAKAAGLAIGDVVLAVDGETIEARSTRLARCTAASTPQALRWRVSGLLLRGPKDSVARLLVRGGNGREREVEIKRSVSWPAAFFSEGRTTPVYRVLPSGFGYVDLARLKNEDSDKALDEVMGAPAIIFDMRGYPNGTAWTIGPRLTKPGARVAAAQFRRPIWKGNALGDSDLAGGSDFAFVQYVPETTKARYTGKVVMLIDESAISQAEHTCLFFEAATDVTFVGSPTNGANGDVTNLVLPGGITVSFTGHDVRHADGRRLQRLGIQPTVRAEPTIAGLRAGRDEVLEAAVRYLETSLPKRGK